jgi:hypothetical protein
MKNPLITLLDAYIRGDLLGDYPEDYPDCPCCGEEVEKFGPDFRFRRDARLGHAKDCALWEVALRELPWVEKRLSKERRQRRLIVAERLRRNREAQKLKEESERRRKEYLAQLDIEETDIRDIIYHYATENGVVSGAQIRELGIVKWSDEEWETAVKKWKVAGRPRVEKKAGPLSFP